MDAESFLASYAAGQSAFRVPDSLADRFTLVSCLKYAPGGQVYLLTGADGKPYILRAAPAEAYERLLREHLTLRRLHDPAFPHPVACFREGEKAYLIREYIPGMPLSELVENGDPLPPARAVKYAREICAILRKLHALDPPVIHRDIKPHNFILTPEGRLCLVDLDAASEYRPDSWLDTVVLGTAATAAPEQFGYRRCDMRTDVYGVGMVLVFLMTGDYDPHAFSGASIGRAPRRIVEKCVRFDPEMRYPSMAALSRALARWQHGRWRLPVFAALALALVLGAGGVCANRSTVWKGLARGASAVSHFANALSRDDYMFYSPLVEKAVRLQLDKPEGPITREDLLRVESLFICADEVYARADELWTQGNEIHLNGNPVEGTGVITDLSDLRFMPNLKKIGLSRLNLSDLSPLLGLTPSYLNLSGNKFEDLSQILRIKGIESLNLSDNPVATLDGIGDLIGLTALDISATDVTDLSPLRDISLVSLIAYDMPAELDLSVLPHIATMNSIAVNRLTPEQCACVEGMTWLGELTLNDCGLTDISFLTNFKGLGLLNLYDNPISSLAPLAGSNSLVYIGMDGTGLTDLSVFATIPNLEQLGIRRNPDADLSALDDMPALTLLYISADMLPNLPLPADEYPFTIQS